MPCEKTCKGTTSKKSPCKKCAVKGGGGYCSWHRPGDVQTMLDAAKAGDFGTMKAILEKDVSLVNQQPGGRWSALHQAAHHADRDAIALLLKLGADPSLRNREGHLPWDVLPGKAQQTTSFQQLLLPQTAPPREFVLKDERGRKVAFHVRNEAVPPFHRPAYFCKHALMTSRQGGAGPVMLVALEDMRTLERETHAGAFGEDIARLGKGIVPGTSSEWLAVWKFPGDLNLLPGFKPILDIPLPVGEYPLLVDDWFVPPDDAPLFPQLRWGHDAAVKLRVDRENGPSVHCLHGRKADVAMIGHHYFIKGYYKAEGVPQLKRMLSKLRDACGIFAFPCYGQHHAFVFYADLQQGGQLLTPALLSHILRGKRGDDIVKVLRQASIGGDLDAWRANYVSAPWASSSSSSSSSQVSAVSYNLSWATALHKEAGSEAKFVRDKCPADGVCRTNAIRSLVQLQTKASLYGFQEYVPWDGRHLPRLHEKNAPFVFRVGDDHPLAPNGAQVRSLFRAGTNVEAYVAGVQKSEYYAALLTCWDTEVFGTAKRRVCDSLSPYDGRPCFAAITSKGFLIINAHAPQPHSATFSDVFKRIENVCRKLEQQPSHVVVTGDFNDAIGDARKGTQVLGVSIPPPPSLLKTCCYEPGYGMIDNKYRLTGDYVLSSLPMPSVYRVEADGSLSSEGGSNPATGRSDHEPVLALLNVV